MSESSFALDSQPGRAKRYAASYGFWTGLLGVGIVLSPLKSLVSFSQSFGTLKPFFASPLLKFQAFGYGMVAAEILTVGYAVAVAAAFLGRKRSFISLYYGLAAVSVAQLMVFALWAGTILPNGMALFASEAGPATGGYLIGWGIWALYLYRSKRVAKTFLA